MPIIEVTLIEGRPPSLVREFAHAITQAACEVLEAPAESVRVIVHPIPPDMFFAGDKDSGVRLGPAPSQVSH